MIKDIKKYIPWIVLALIVISLSVWYLLSRRVTKEQEEQYKSRVEEARVHLEAKQYSSSMNKYYEAIEIIPNRVDAFEGVLSILISKNRYEDATKIIEESAKKLNNSDKSILYKMVGDAYYDSSMYRESFDMYDRGLVLGVVNMPLELSLGKAYLNLGNIDSAKAQFKKSGYQGDAEMEAKLLLAYIYALEDKEKAENAIKGVDPSDSMKIYFEELEGVLGSFTDDEKFNATKISRIYLNNGYPYLAIKKLEPLKDEMAEYLEGMYYLGRAYYANGENDKAIEILDSALSLGGMEGEILHLKAKAYVKKNDLDNAIKSFESSLGYAGSEFGKDIVEEYVQYLMSKSQALRAYDVVRDLLQVKPSEPYLSFLAIEISNKAEDGAKVEYYISQLEKLELDNKDKEKFLGYKIGFLLKEGKDVETELGELFELDRYNPEYYLLLAKDYVSKNDNEMAIQSLEKALEYDLGTSISEDSSKLLSSLR